MKTFILSVLYFVTGILYIIFNCQSDLITAFVLKALIIPLLLVLFYINKRPPFDSLHYMMLAGLVFSWAGDIMLELPQKNEMFMPGLICFLMAHIMYLSVFFSTPGKNIILKNHFYLLIPVVLYGAGLLFYLYDDLGNMRIPVIIYAVVILTMLSGALSRFDKVNRSSYLLVLFGAILFVISDSLIAINKFSHPFRSSGLLIMTTYILAQFLIISGFIRQYDKSFI